MPPCRTTRDTIVVGPMAQLPTKARSICHGQNVCRQTTQHKAWRDDSAWARGLAWSLYWLA